MEIRKGMKIIRADGVCGKIIGIEDGRTEPPCTFFVEYDTGEKDIFTLDGTDKSMKDFYLIGRTVIGNKIDEKEILKKMDELNEKMEPLRKKYDQLRKQLWYLRERMQPDWKEREAKKREERTEYEVQDNFTVTCGRTDDSNKTE